MTKKILEEECKKYKPDVDLEGSGEKDLGHSLAERIIQKYGAIEKIPFYNKEFNKKPIKEIILTSPEVIGKSPNVNFLVKANLKELKKEGYLIKESYGKMNPTKLWNYYLSVLKENGYFNSL
jgi:hypothetical protein